MASKPEERFKFEWLRTVGQMRLGASMKNLAGWLSYHANRDGTNVRPGLELLRQETELSERYLRTCLKRFCELGLLVRVSKGSTSAHRNWVDVYRLALPDGFEAGSPPPELPGSDGQPLVQRRGSKANHTRWHVNKGKVEANCFHCTAGHGESSEGSGNPASEATTGNTQSETTGNTHPTTGPYRSTTKQCFTKHVETHHPSPSGAARKTGAREIVSGYRDFFDEQWDRIVPYGEQPDEDETDHVCDTINRAYVDAALDDLNKEEEIRVDGMLSSGKHPDWIVNDILSQRREAAA